MDVVSVGHNNTTRADETLKALTGLHGAAHALMGPLSYLMAHRTMACTRAVCEAALESRDAAEWGGPRLRQLVEELCRQMELVEQNRRAVLASE